MTPSPVRSHKTTPSPLPQLKGKGRKDDSSSPVDWSGEDELNSD